MTTPFRVLITGSRHCTDKEKIGEQLIALPKNSIVITGGCKGTDTIAHQISIELKLETEVYYANWRKYGNKAGPIRNEEMITKNIDLVLAFPLEDSIGTYDTIRRAQKRKIPVKIIS